MISLLGIFFILVPLLGTDAKWVEGRVDTKDNWAFLARFCFLSLDGQFEYLIEFDRDMGVPNLMLYYDDDNQWPSVYHSSKTCKEREAVLNKAGQNQMIKLSHWYPDTEYSGCIITKENKELPASMSTTSTTQRPLKSTTTSRPKNSSNPPKTDAPIDPTYYDQFLKTTTPSSKTTISDSNTTWYEAVGTDEFSVSTTELLVSTTELPEGDLWENIGPEFDGSHHENLDDVELLFDNRNRSGHKIKRSTLLYEQFKHRRLHSSGERNVLSHRSERLLVSCHNSRRFRSARERWWFIAISNCNSDKGLDVRYRFLMTNGLEGDFWHHHFSADEFYVLPVLIAYSIAYVVVMIAVVMCSVELKARHLLHSTYKLFGVSTTMQHCGILIQSLASLRYAIYGFGVESVRTTGQFFCGISETTFLLLLILLGKGYTVTRGRLKASFTVQLTVFMCAYIVTYVALFVYQAKAFDPGEVLYLYESPAGYGIIALRVLAWCAFAYSSYFTVRKFPEKHSFYYPFFICGTLWFYAGPLFILTANSYIDKWVRESVVTAVLLFITFCGHLMFLLLTLPVFANKNFPYHVRTTQIGVMEVAGSSALDSFGPNAYHPGGGGGGGAPQTVIIPLTRRTEELIGNIYNQYMATAPPMSLENSPPLLNGIPRSLPKQDSIETNTSDDIKPYLQENKDIFSVESQMAKREGKLMLPANNNPTGMVENTSVFPANGAILKDTGPVLPANTTGLPGQKALDNIEKSDSLPTDTVVEGSRSDLSNVLRSKRKLEPIKRDVPTWSLAKGPSVVAMQKKADVDTENANGYLHKSNLPFDGNLPNNGNLPVTGNLPSSGTIPSNGKKVPPVKNGMQPSSGEILTILEGHVQSYKNNVSNATIDLFSANSSK